MGLEQEIKTICAGKDHTCGNSYQEGQDKQVGQTLLLGLLSCRSRMKCEDKPKDGNGE